MHVVSSPRHCKSLIIHAQMCRQLRSTWSPRQWRILQPCLDHFTLASIQHFLPTAVHSARWQAIASAMFQQSLHESATEISARIAPCNCLVQGVAVLHAVLLRAGQRGERHSLVAGRDVEAEAFALPRNDPLRNGLSDQRTVGRTNRTK